MTDKTQSSGSSQSGSGSQGSRQMSQSSQGKQAQGFVSEITINAQSGGDPTQALQGILPTASSQRGFQGAMHLTDPQSGSSKVLLQWEDEQAYQQARQSSGYAEQISRLGQEQTFQVVSSSMGSPSSGSSGQSGNPSTPQA